MEAKRSHEAIFCTFAFYRSHDAKTEALRGDAWAIANGAASDIQQASANGKRSFREVEAGAPPGNRAKIVNGRGTAVL